MTSRKLPISVLILTKNEEQDLPGCLASLTWSDDVHVYDSLSDDRTLDIARAAGASIIQRPFDNWAAHQNWGLRNIRFKHPWVFYIDADERVPHSLAEAMAAAVAAPGENVAFRIERRDFMEGTWLKHVAATAHYTRLFKPEFVHYERLINPVTCVAGPIGQLDAHFDHFPFSKGMSHWFARHNSYSSFEAQQLLDERESRPSPSLGKALFSSDLAERRRHQKEIYYRLPMRPLIMFLAMYVLKRGFLDGRAGLRFCLLRAIYEYMIVLKTKELEERHSGC